jgi:hypothetical protein
MKKQPRGLIPRMSRRAIQTQIYGVPRSLIDINLASFGSAGYACNGKRGGTKTLLHPLDLHTATPRISPQENRFCGDSPAETGATRS